MPRILPGVLVLLSLSGCTKPQASGDVARPAGAPAATPQASSCETCRTARLSNQWCDNCKVGYVAGVPIKSAFLFHAMDAHGHDLDLSTIKCVQCQKAIETDGYCEGCRIGWVNKQAYFSRLTHHLGKAKSIDLPRQSCSQCRKNAESCAWCDTCAVGMIGSFATSEKAEFESAQVEYRRLVAAVKLSKRCERCAVAFLTDTACFDCKLTFKDGVARPSPSPP